jgi:hypothetical protein
MPPHIIAPRTSLPTELVNWGVSAITTDFPALLLSELSG